MHEFQPSSAGSAPPSSGTQPAAALSPHGFEQATQPERLYALLNERIQEPPPEHSRLLYICGRRCGRITLAACDALRAHRGVLLHDEALRLGDDMRPGPQVDTLLADIATTLRQADCLRGWRDELLDIHDEQGGRLGAIERAAMRPLGLLTRAVHLNAWTPDGLLWVARRALTKATDPGMWDTLVGGLAGSGETLDTALLRECDEEAGLHAAELSGRSPLRTVARMHRRLPEGYQVEDLLISTCVLDAGTQPRNRDGEVMEITTVSAERALAMVCSGEFTLEAALVIVDDILRRGA